MYKGIMVKKTLDFALQSSIMLCPDMGSGDVLERAAASKCHGQLKLILEHVNHSPHPVFPHSSQTKGNRPSNLRLDYAKAHNQGDSTFAEKCARDHIRQQKTN